MDSNDTTISAVKGSIYFLIQAWFSTGINFLASIILARILFPEDFGISSISFTIVGIFSVFVGFGLGPGVIQSKREKEKLFSTFFFVEIFTAIVISLIIFSISGTFANIFMDARIKPVIQVLTIYTLLMGFNAIPRTYLTKELEFKKIALVEILSVIVNLCTSLIFVYLGFGFWSLIYGPIMSTIFNTICYWILAPIFPKLSKFDSEIFKELLRFAVPLLLASVVVFWNTHIDDIVVAQVITLEILGFYILSYRLSNYLATLISFPISRAMYPIYCKIHDDDVELKSNFEYNYRMVLTITIFITFYILINAQFIISILFGSNWLNSIPILQILIFEGFLRALASIPDKIFMALNKTYLFLIINCVYFGLMTPLMFFSTIYFGYVGTALSVTLSYIPILIISFWWVRKYIKYDITKDTFIRLFGVILTIPPMLLVFFLLNDNPILVLVLNLGIALAIYSLVVNYLTKGEFMKEIKEIFNIFLNRKPKENQV